MCQTLVPKGSKATVGGAMEQFWEAFRTSGMTGGLWDSVDSRAQVQCRGHDRV